MKQSKSFVEQEFERERKLTNSAKPGFQLLNRFKFIFVDRPIQRADRNTANSAE